MTNQKVKNVAVVHGGTSLYRDESIKYGREILNILKKENIPVFEIHLHPNGSWTKDGEVKNLEHAFVGVEYVWNALLGEDASNFLVEDLCEKCKVKILGHKKVHTHIAGSKHLLKNSLKQHKIKSPYSKVLNRNNIDSESLKHAFQMVGLPAIVKPVDQGTKDIFWINNFEEYKNAVEKIFQKNKDVLVEKPIVGKSVSCIILPHESLLHTFVLSEEDLGREENMLIRNEALFIHNVLSFPNHVRYDFIVSPKGVYLLGADTHFSLSSGHGKKIFSDANISLSEYLLKKLSS